MRKSSIAPIIIAAMLLFSAAVYSSLPQAIPSHWTIDGQTNETLPKAVGALLMPVVAAGVWLLLTNLPRFDPKRANYPQFQDTLTWITVLVTGFAALVHVLMLGAGLGWQIDTSRLIIAAAGLLFIGIGALLPSVTAQNYFVGIRTPWTLEDPEVWRLTHRAAGKFFIIGGLAGVVGALLLSMPLSIAVLLVGMLGATVATAHASWQFYRQLHPQA